ncbi:hypothetical protein E5Q_04821 [Mixia osmundae IAM 14324]|uniref:Uncharacterized protein n=1 Tax=Mixia osmundae (strain CBS 9802 / IAM 14324 / JCM 22182 / KY 12970) TaxID=764103 RepID=G7E5M8_MIXOS|nr:hypothetical protein E5Q_04821 [Mixia osmundae IAM 14324]
MLILHSGKITLGLVSLAYLGITQSAAASAVDDDKFEPINSNDALALKAFGYGTSNSGCYWATDRLGRRTGAFHCPKPCILRRHGSHPPKPRNWLCPPIHTSTSSVSRSESCFWNRKRGLTCPHRCHFALAVDEASSTSIGWVCQASPEAQFGPDHVHEEGSSDHDDEHKNIVHAPFVTPFALVRGTVNRYEHNLRSKLLCKQAGDTACPLQSGDDGAALVPGGAYECLNTDFAYSSCGGSAIQQRKPCDRYTVVSHSKVIVRSR